jgi:protein involved in polysaccharide export with SLBB domain
LVLVLGSEIKKRNLQGLHPNPIIGVNYFASEKLCNGKVRIRERGGHPVWIPTMDNIIKALLLAATLLLSNIALGSSDYRLGTGDEIRIQVYEENDLSMSLLLDEAGTFNYPYLGTLVAKGKTIVGLKKEITDGLLLDILVNPSVNVSIISYRDFYIGGEVKRSGGYSFQPGLTVKQAITLAGGVTEWASSSKIEILREGAKSPETANNNTLVRPGDTVTILEGLF